MRSHGVFNLKLLYLVFISNLSECLFFHVFSKILQVRVTPRFKLILINNFSRQLKCCSCRNEPAALNASLMTASLHHTGLRLFGRGEAPELQLVMFVFPAKAGYRRSDGALDTTAALSPLMPPADSGWFMRFHTVWPPSVRCYAT